jgi:MarR family 2-MHQ and catechol resistance regulon transcriptional repressor
MGTHFKGGAGTVRALDAYIKMMRAANSVNHRISLSLAEHKLTPSQFGVLETLMHLGRQQQHSLGEKLLRSGGNITTVVDNLEKRKLILRERCTDDRRCIWVQLTKDGSHLIESVFPRIAELITQGFSVLAKDELLAFGDFCKRIGLTANDSITANNNLTA